jgi:hypothetical protein
MSFLSTPISIFTSRKERNFGGIKANVVIEESTQDTLTITKQPVQQGASITDHAFKEPTVFNTVIMFRDNPLKSLSKIYQELLELQLSRVPFDIVTPKRIYKSMLIASLGQTTDRATENILKITASFQQVVLVSVQTVQVPKGLQRLSKITQGTSNVGRKSILSTGVDAFTELAR